MENQIEVAEKNMIEKPDVLDSAISEYKIPDMTMQTISNFRKAEAIECVDTASRKVLGKHRKNVKSLISDIEIKRLDNNREYKEKNNGYAELLKDTLGLSRDVFDKKIKDYDSVSEEKKLAKAKIEQEKLDVVNGYIRALEYDCSPLEYGLSSEKIAGEIRFLEEIQISAVDYGDRTEDAEMILAGAMSQARVAFAVAVKYEADQAEIARIKAEQKAEMERLAIERAEFEKAQIKEKKKQEEIQAKIEQERKGREDEAALIAAQEAEKTRKAAEKVEADRLALEKEKADMEAEKQADIDRQYAVMFDTATDINMFTINDSAIEMNKTFDIKKAEDEKIRLEKLTAEKARAELVAHDKKTAINMIEVVNDFISEFNLFDGEYKTNEGAQIELDLIIRIKRALDSAKIAASELV